MLHHCLFEDNSQFFLFSLTRGWSLHLALIVFLLAPFALGEAAGQKLPAVNLVGSWESIVELGKSKIRVIVRLIKSPEGRITGKIEIPDQGAKNIPVSAILCNYPAIRWEIDPFDNTSFNGRLNDAGDEIAGAFDEGPGGRPLPAVFRRLPETDATAQTRIYTFAPGEARDIRGFWGATIDTAPETVESIGLKIGRSANGAFDGLLALLDRGVNDAAASSLEYTNLHLKLEWQLFRITLDGTLNADGSELTGAWKQNGTSTPVTFSRLDKPATLLPPGVSFIPDTPEDACGYWKGTLEPPGSRLRLVLKIGRVPGGSIVGTLASLDQDGNEIPMSKGAQTNSIVRLEWKPLHAVFKGTLKERGTVLDGTWEQMGPPLTLRLERTTPSEERNPKAD